MARSGVESLRVPISWVAAQPVRGPISFAETDQIVGFAARHGISLLPLVLDAPRWASSAPKRDDYYHFPPIKHPKAYTDYLVALIDRYGSHGTFWRANPSLPRNPVLAWQIWNEPGYRYFFGPKDYKRAYPALLKAAYKAVHRADPKARVVMAGLANTGLHARIWNDLAAFYRAGVERYFDVLALHPFGATLRSSLLRA